MGGPSGNNSEKKSGNSKSDISESKVEVKRKCFQGRLEMRGISR